MQLYFGLLTDLYKNKVPIHCHGCIEGHMQRTLPVSLPGHTITTDIGGPLPATPEGSRYFITFTDLHTCHVVVVLFKRKSEAEGHILSVLHRLSHHFGRNVARVRSDNANEFLEKALTRTLPASCILLDSTIPHTPQENSISERLNFTLSQRIRATLTVVKLPFDKYWGSCLLDITTKYNVCLYTGINAIPRQLWSKHRQLFSPFPDEQIYLRNFHMFPEYGHVHDFRSTKTKPDPRGTSSSEPVHHRRNPLQLLILATGQMLTARINNLPTDNPKFDHHFTIHTRCPLQRQSNYGSTHTTSTRLRPMPSPLTHNWVRPRPVAPTPRQPQRPHHSPLPPSQDLTAARLLPEDPA